MVGVKFGCALRPGAAVACRARAARRRAAARGRGGAAAGRGGAALLTGRAGAAGLLGRGGLLLARERERLRLLGGALVGRGVLGRGVAGAGAGFVGCDVRWVFSESDGDIELESSETASTTRAMPATA